jgi:hypothetical protein
MRLNDLSSIDDTLLPMCDEIFRTIEPVGGVVIVSYGHIHSCLLQSLVVLPALIAKGVILRSDDMSPGELGQITEEWVGKARGHLMTRIEVSQGEPVHERRRQDGLMCIVKL